MPHMALPRRDSRRHVSIKFFPGTLYSVVPRHRRDPDLAGKPNLKIGQLLYGIATFIPGVAAVFGRGGGDTSSARYCYSVWLRHLVVAAANGFKVPPRVVAELGPGDSLGL